MTERSERVKGPPELTYHGKPLDPHPINMRLGDAARLLRDEGMSAQVVLEPGDATRYEFIIAPLREERDYEIVGGTPDALFVGRTIGGKLVASAIIPSTEDEWQFERGVETIGLYEGRPGNPWRCKLFDWWFRTLWARLEDYE